MKGERIYYYDIVKCIASYLICLSHFGTLDVSLTADRAGSVYFYNFFLGLASAGVPIFLMANGSFLLNKSYPLSKILNRAKAFWVLYIIWGIITLLVLMPLYHDHYSVGHFVNAVVFQKAQRTEHLWFMLAMVYIYLLFPFVKALYDKPGKSYITYLVVLVFLCTFGLELIDDVVNTMGYYLQSNTLKAFRVRHFVPFNPFNPWFAYTLFYFISGGLLAKHIQTIRVQRGVLWGAILISLLTLFLFGLLNTKVRAVEYDSVWSGQDTIMGMVMAFSLFLLCSKIRLHNTKLIAATKLVGLNTLGIYFIHVPLGFYLTPHYEKLVISRYFFADIFYALLVMMLSLAISVLIKQIPVVKRLVQIS